MSTCLHPVKVTKDGVSILYPCGKCPICRQNARQAISNRFMLEAAFSGGSTFFCTFTYSDDFLPRCSPVDTETGEIYDWLPLLADGSTPCFRRSDVVNLLDKMHDRYYKDKYNIPDFVHFFTCEYGDLYNRPHYHSLFFFRKFIPIQVVRSFLAVLWPFGIIDVSTASDDSIAYCAKYALKDSHERYLRVFKGDFKPFRIFSRNPGVGASAIPWLNQYILNGGDIRGYLTYNGKRFVFDQYIKRHLPDDTLKLLQSQTYDKNFDDIQKGLGKNYLANRKEVRIFDEDNNEWVTIYHNDYTKDDAIKKRRFEQKVLKKISKSNLL